MPTRRSRHTGYLPSLYIAEQRDVEAVELPW
jgi:hypothetical protein